MILKILTIALVLAIMSILATQAMAEDNQIEKYKAIYNGLCNVQVVNNIKADLPHATMNITIDKGSTASISPNGMNYTTKNAPNETIELNLTPESSVISMRYEF